MTTSRSVGCASSTLAERGAEAATPKSRTETNIVLRIAAIVIASLNPLDARQVGVSQRPSAPHPSSDDVGVGGDVNARRLDARRLVETTSC